jgi:hypothetical protein
MSTAEPPAPAAADAAPRAPRAPSPGRRTLFDRLDDALNPIVVKELRQAVQSRFVVAVLLVFLVAQLLWIGVRLLIFGVRADLDSIEFQAGREVFIAQQGILLFTCMIFLPLYTGIRLAAERNDANTDLLYVTTIKPGAIVFGKLLSAVVLAILILSACMPFMALTYYLRGIDWPSIAVILGIDLLVVVLSVQAMVFLAVIPCSRVFKSMLALGGLLVLCWTLSGTMIWTSELSRTGVSSFFRDTMFWIYTANIVFSMLAACGFLYVWSIAMLAVPSANRALPVRVFSLMVWFGGLALVVIQTPFWSASMPQLPVQLWTVLMTMLACLSLAIAIGERRHFSPRLTRTIPRWGIFRRLAFVFYSGAAGGVLFSMMLMFLTMTASAIVGYFTPENPIWRLGDRPLGPLGVPKHRIDDTHLALLIACALGFVYTMAYGMTAVFLRSRLLRRLPPLTTPLIAVILLGLGSMVPWFIGNMIFLRSWRGEDQHYWLLANPFTAMSDVNRAFRADLDLQRGLHYMVFAVGWAILAVLVNIPWALAQFDRFRRPADPPPAPATLEEPPEPPSPPTEQLPEEPIAVPILPLPSGAIRG